MVALVITSAVTLTVAGLGFWITFRNNRRLAERNDLLARINRQLADLYGPLMTLAATADISFRTFMKAYGKGNMSAFDRNGEPLVDKDEWMVWIRSVLMPLNRQLAERILKGGDLLLESDVPQVLLDFSAHVSSWEAVLAKWDQGDTRQLVAVVNHPGRELYRHAVSSYSKLKASQAELLAVKESKSAQHIYAALSGVRPGRRV
jgi:hypothetical protein